MIGLLADPASLLLCVLSDLFISKKNRWSALGQNCGWEISASSHLLVIHRPGPVDLLCSILHGYADHTRIKSGYRRPGMAQEGNAMKANGHPAI